MNKKNRVHKIIISALLLLQIYGKLYSQNLYIANTKYLPENDTVLIFIPDNYNNTHKRFPVMYMLHGYGGNYKTWNKIIDLQKYANNYEFIIVCPDGLYDCWYINSPVNNKYQFENFLIKELYSYINNTYRTNKDNIFITGLSMGGYGALHIFAGNTNKFKSAGSTSGLLDPLPFGQYYGLEKILGNINSNKQNYIDFSIFSCIAKLKKNRFHLITDCGVDDPFFLQNKMFFDLCSKSGVKISFTHTAGNHNREYWQESIKEHFKYFYYLSNK